ncbi:MAG: hypothetical protein V3T60_01195 [Candidatus Binatia bacterium]
MRHACKGLLLLALLIRLLACTRAANLALIRAALAGDTVAVLDLLAAGANVNAKKTMMECRPCRLRQRRATPLPCKPGLKRAQN